MSFKEARKKAKLTQTQAAKEFSVSRQTICNWEAGTDLPKAERLPLIARTYGCTVDDLLKGSDEET